MDNVLLHISVGLAAVPIVGVTVADSMAYLKELGMESTTTIDAEDIGLATISKFAAKEWVEAHTKRLRTILTYPVLAAIGLVLQWVFDGWNGVTNELPKLFYYVLAPPAVFAVGVFLVKLYFAPYHFLKKVKVENDDLKGQISQIEDRFSFAAVLASRNNQIREIKPASMNHDVLARAFQQLHEKQEMVIKSLRRTESEWSFAPAGWNDAADAPALFVWAGIASVLAERYADELSPPASLYDPIDMARGRIAADNFPAVKEHAIQVVALIIREIEYPEWPKAAEKPDTFTNTVAFFKQQASRTRSSRPSTLAS